MNYQYTELTVQPSKYQQAYDHPDLIEYVPSAKIPHLDALETAGMIEKLDLDDIVIIIKLMQNAYRNGQAHQGAEKIDEGTVWINGIGGLELQSDGTWMLTMPDKKNIEISPSLAASTLGSSKTARKAKTSATNGKLGGRPPKK